MALMKIDQFMVNGLEDDLSEVNSQLAQKANKAQEAWIEATLQNNWVNFGAGYPTASYFKDEFGTVHIKGTIKSGVTTGNTVLFNLPAGYRPDTLRMQNVISNNALCRVDVNTNGDVTVVVGGSTAYITFTDINFRV